MQDPKVTRAHFQASPRSSSPLQVLGSAKVGLSSLLSPCRGLSEEVTRWLSAVSLGQISVKGTGGKEGGTRDLGCKALSLFL